MIGAHEFVEAARAEGFLFYAGVPCSYLETFIDHVIRDDRLVHLSAANEGDAVASALGSTLGGRPAVAFMQNSGLGNAVNPLVSLAWPFRMPVLLIVTLRGDPDLGDEPQHLVMGRTTGSLLDTMEIPWEWFPTDRDEIAPALQRARSHMRRDSRPYALVMRKGTLAPHPHGDMRPPAVVRSERRDAVRHVCASVERPSRTEVLRRIRDRSPLEGSVVVATTGYTGRELYALDDRPNHLYMVGSMGCATSLALGLSLVRPDLRVVVVEGDGAALMRMGNYATLGAYGGDNLIHLVLDNEMHESTGGQSTVSAGVSFAGVAAACGYGFAVEGSCTDVVDQVFDAGGSRGPRFGQIKICPGVAGPLPRPALAPHEVKERLVDHIGAAGA
ncbi:MAG: phosphonopyruvate decarboxylase [Actinomycetota bacterium]|nr:phosphonopyruvate decarboxylase [Actinomycetota bacterium]